MTSLSFPLELGHEIATVPDAQNGAGSIAAATLVRKACDEVVFTLVRALNEGDSTAEPSRRVASWNASSPVGWRGHSEDVSGVLSCPQVVVLNV